MGGVAGQCGFCIRLCPTARRTENARHIVSRPMVFDRRFRIVRVASIVGRALVSGTAATVTSAAVLALVAAAEGKGPAQPLNATSHWLYGKRAAAFSKPNIKQTTVGLATHHAATIFWALVFETSLSLRPTRGPAAIFGRATAIGTLAAIVDYTITPERFTPGWELVLTKRSMALVYGAMAAGFGGAAIGRGLVR